MAEHLVIVHGWSDSASGFKKVADFLSNEGLYKEEHIKIINYKSLDDQVTMEDFADKLNDRFEELYIKENVARIDIICHSTGSLVVRAWLALRRQRQRRRGQTIDSPVEHLFMFAPANFGSDLAKLGQSGLHRLRTTFRLSLNQDVGIDTFEVGENILQALEPASPTQWKLSNIDLHEETYFGNNDPSKQVCFPFVFSGGTFKQDGIVGSISNLIPKVSKPGTDSTVRICGTSLNTRKCMIRLLKKNEVKQVDVEWVKEQKFSDIPFVVFHEYNHNSVVKVGLSDEAKLALDGQTTVLELFKKAKSVKTSDDYEEINKLFANATRKNYEIIAQNTDLDIAKLKAQYQQFFFKAKDDTDCDITDYNIDFFVCNQAGALDEKLTAQCDELLDNEANWHRHSVDHSCRILMLNCSELLEFCQKIKDQGASLTLSITAKGASQEIFFPDFQVTIFGERNAEKKPTHNSEFEQSDHRIDFLCPNTTTLVEIILDRQQDRVILDINT